MSKETKEIPRTKSCGCGRCLWSMSEEAVGMCATCQRTVREGRAVAEAVRKEASDS